MLSLTRNIFISNLFLMSTATRAWSTKEAADSVSRLASTSTKNSPLRVTVVGGTHGNEYTGVWVLKSLTSSSSSASPNNNILPSLTARYPSLHIDTLLGNPAAHTANRRFIDSDLNREFPITKLSAPPTHSLESQRAHELNDLLGPKSTPQRDIIVDLHTTTCNMGLTLIIPEGDALMGQAAAYVSSKVPNTKIIMHSTFASRMDRPNLSSLGRHGFTVEVGPVPQGVLRHDVVESTEAALHAFLEFVERTAATSSSPSSEDITATSPARKLPREMMHELLQSFPSGEIPCYCSAPALHPGEMSGKLQWPCDPQNPNFPEWMVHSSIQDGDFQKVRKGDALFVKSSGEVIRYDGSHGEEVILIFVNEGGYYYESSGTGIGVAMQSAFGLEHGMLKTQPTQTQTQTQANDDTSKQTKRKITPLVEPEATNVPLFAEMNVVKRGRGGSQARTTIRQEQTTPSYHHVK